MRVLSEKNKSLIYSIFLCFYLPHISDAFVLLQSKKPFKYAFKPHKYACLKSSSQLSVSMNPSDDAANPSDDGKNKDVHKNKTNVSASGDDASPLWNVENMETLNIRIARMRLEEENRRKMVKSRPRKLPYNQCKQWVQRQNMWHSKEEWYQWVDMGEGLSTYIPSDPETYYKSQGSWVSWSDFLGR